MSVIETKNSSLVPNRKTNFCCISKHYYSNNIQNLVKSLKIVPRVIIYKKRLRADNSYETIIYITNKGLYNRLLLYTTDSNDTTVSVFPKSLTDNFLEPDKSSQITVCIKPQQKTRINRRRHVFITCKHPDITFSIPIIILAKDDNIISVPSSITFPSGVVNNFTFYEMILYNKSMQKCSFNIKCAYPNLTVHVKSFNIPKMDYIKILLQLNCMSTQVVNDVIKLRLNLGDCVDIPFTHEPMQWGLFVETLYIKFETLIFNRKETRELRICNESANDIVFFVDFAKEEENLLQDHHIKAKKATLRDNDSLNEINPNESRELKFQDKFASRHFKLKPKCATIPANSAFQIEVTFCPVIHKDFKPSRDEIPPFVILSCLIVTSKDEMKTEKRHIILKGLINGPEIEILPKTIDLRHVYFGEEHCLQIKVNNTDDICDAHVDFYDIISRDMAQIVVEPKNGLTIKPYQSGVINLQFFATVNGKFMVKLEFKVKNGGIYSIMIKGYSQRVRVKCFPDTLDLGVVPIAMPQKRLVLLMNPLSVPLTVSCTVMEDGYETPLVLNTHDVNKHLPINLNDPVFGVRHANEIENARDFLKDGENEFKFLYSLEGQESSVLSFQSANEEDSSYSTEFEEQALDCIPDITKNFVSYLKTIRIFDKPEMELTVIEEALNGLLKTPYFIDITKYKNYTQMDWNSLATDPKEIYCNHEIIHLKPNTGKAIGIVVIPNVVGYQHKHVVLRVCPLMPPPDDDENPDLQTIMNSDYMTSKLWINYNCSVPKIVWDNVVIMQDKLYAGEWYNFEMSFENHSKICGFFFYDVTPNSSLGCMKFPNKKWKYFIGPDSETNVPCTVQFKKLGYVVLAGLIKFVGVYTGYPFHIKSEVLPPKVSFCPSSIVETLEVLEKRKLYVFIENATPSTTWFKLKLKEEKNIFVEPCGGQLAPTSQAVYITLDLFYNDPGTYKNILYIILQFETIEKIPITIHVKGMPIFFEPEICIKNLNIGYVLCNTEDEYLEDKSNYSKVIKVINKGLRNYRIVITRIRNSAKPTCTLNSRKAKIIITPNNFTMAPLSEDCFTIFTNCCEETSIFNEFRVEIIDLIDPKRILSQRFIVTATFIYPQLTWHRQNITMNYYRTHKFKEQPQWESVKLTNNANNLINFVSLKLTGPFKMKELFEHQFVKELQLSMVGSETKKLYILLDKDMMRNSLDTSYEGSLTCYANAKQQKSVKLYAKMFTPELIIKQSDVVLFTKSSEGVTFIELINSEDIPAIYKWKKLKEEWHYISQEDDTPQIAEIILSDILYGLNLDPINFEDDTEPNMTRRFQKSKCVLNDFNDRIHVNDIIYEIIEHLDLMGRRYKLVYEEPQLPADDSLVQTKNEGDFKDSKVFYHQSFQNPNDHIQEQIEQVLNMQIPSNQEQFLKKISEIEDNLNSQTLYEYVNRKFSMESSQSTIEELSSSETCVFYTLNHVFSHLKLEDSYVISEPSTDTCEPIKTVNFFKKYGILQKNEKELCALHIPAIKRGFEVRAMFQLDVVGGKSQQFQITLVNLDKTIKLSENNIYLGLKPWYEKYETKVCAENVTNYLITLNINYVSRPEENINKIAAGYVKILNKKTIPLSALQNTYIKTEGIMGFSEEFRRELRILINDGEELTLNLRGQGVMPMLAVANCKLPYVEQDQFETIDDYRFLQKIYYFEVFKPIIEKDDEEDGLFREEDNVRIMTDLTLLSTSDSKTDSESTRSSVKTEKELRFFKVIQSYVLVNNNEELPNSTVLNQFLETEKFLNHLRFNQETGFLLNKVYHEYAKLSKSYDDKIRINLKHFTTQPLPFQLKGHIMEMGKLFINQYSKFIITLEFFGPGKLIASARTIIQIPGLMIDFETVENTGDKEFIYYRSDNKLNDLYDKSYRNVYERKMDANTDPKVKHAHSYDINKKLQHQRDTRITVKDRKCLMHYYNSLNKSIYMEQKHHFTHCKLFSNRKYNFSVTKINIVLLFKPKNAYYKHNQRIEDYIYIDLHMGPTLPIMLRGTIVDRDRKDTTTSSSYSEQ